LFKDRAWPKKLKLCGPPNVPMSMSLYRVCCAASGTGSTSTADSTEAAKINFADFMLPPV